MSKERLSVLFKTSIFLARIEVLVGHKDCQCYNLCHKFLGHLTLCRRLPLSPSNVEKKIRSFTQKIPNFVLFSTLHLGEKTARCLKIIVRDCSLCVCFVIVGEFVFGKGMLSIILNWEDIILKRDKEKIQIEDIFLCKWLYMAFCVYDVC